MKIKQLLLVGCVLALGFFLITPIFAQQIEPGPRCNDFEFFPDTRHNVCDQFLDFFNSRGGLEIFGYPITEWFEEDGLLVQYFQRVRMEYRPDNPLAYRVQLGLLGDSFAPVGAKARIAESEKPGANDRERRYFPEIGHTVGFSFLKFYDENGGLDIFGYPITEFIFENGRFVQYFQRALMEWNPNRGGIVLHDLGEVWVKQHNHLRQLKHPILSPSSVTSLYATASVRDAFTGYEGDQTVWIYVYDQNREPVKGASVKLVVHYPLVDDSFSVQDPTDELGHTRTSFALNAPPRGQLVIVDVLVWYGDLTTLAQTSFFPWW